MSVSLEKSGKGKYGNRQEGVLVYKLDIKGLNEVVRSIYELTYDLERPDLTVWPDLVAGYDKAKPDYLEKRNIVLICSEGVGWECNSWGRINVPLYSDKEQWNDSYIEVSTKVVNKFVTEETVDLADHVRVFGDRLENNFDIWAYQLTRTELPKEDEE